MINSLTSNDVERDSSRVIPLVLRLCVWAVTILLFFGPVYFSAPLQTDFRLGEWLYFSALQGDTMILVWIAVLIAWGYTRRETIRTELANSAAPAHVWLFPLALGLYLVGHRIGSLQWIAVSLVIVLLGLICGLHGGVRRTLWVPVTSLLVIIPGVFDGLFFPMRLLTSQLAGLVLNLFMDVHVFGTRVLWGGDEMMQVRVADECSGITALQILLLLGFLFGMFERVERARSWLILLAVVLFAAILTNLIRVLLIIAACQVWGYEFGLMLHDTWAGFIAFIPIVYACSIFLRVLRERGRLA